MTLLRFEPLNDFGHINNFFQKFFDENIELKDSTKENFSPMINISENNDKIYVEAEIPGVNKKDINITLKDNILTIEGEKKSFKNDDLVKIYRSERSFGKFKRSFTLPVNVDSNKVSAKFTDGTLQIELEKHVPEQKKEKVIELK
ncbi:MAG: Hsp20/alpha crystallin family protein [Melioribacteraceae bacterium]|nr:Hsp20/alpha crystallin family protein [Melioribacteraceae bacterium]MCF8263640.1 Hsp20/alpha crystallin family protein [Melioribacteraceae bacterium]MCF8412053.1 Hsp20/alpha crystallin family protein [Melioribacteraceae bacterium]MCF8431894.1 Hsp20/alpha crystallin family protein [Melioribacteraceae bacterium]